MERVLIVDDMPDLLEDMVEAVKDKQRFIHEAKSAEEAKKLIKSYDFDVVITDLRMETDDAGFHVLRAAKRKNPLTQVILVTFYGTPADSVNAMTEGAFDYIERNAPGTEIFTMLKSKVNLAIRFRKALQASQKDI